MTETETTQENDNRLSFAEAVVFVTRQKRPAFAAMPVFGDDDETAEGARIFLLLPDEDEGWILRFVAGPFFSNAYAANDVIPANEIPDRVRAMRFLPTRCEEAWLEDQIQTLIAKLTQAAGIESQMPDYASQPAKAAAPEVVFPVEFIGRGKPH